jgi:hypothetical protein
LYDSKRVSKGDTLKVLMNLQPVFEVDQEDCQRNLRNWLYSMRLYAFSRALKDSNPELSSEKHCRRVELVFGLSFGESSETRVKSRWVFHIRNVRSTVEKCRRCIVDAVMPYNGRKDFSKAAIFGSMELTRVDALFEVG